MSRSRHSPFTTRTDPQRVLTDSHLALDVRYVVGKLEIPDSRQGFTAPEAVLNAVLRQPGSS